MTRTSRKPLPLLCYQVARVSSLSTFFPNLLQVFIDSSMPVIQHYEALGKVGRGQGGLGIHHCCLCGKPSSSSSGVTCMRCCDPGTCHTSSLGSRALLVTHLLLLPFAVPCCQVARINADRSAEDIYKEVRRLFMEF